MVLVIVQPRFQLYLVLIFALVAWFPEFSQTSLLAYTADDVQTLYNFRPIPAITASVFDYLFASIVAFWVAKYLLSAPRDILKEPLATSMLAMFAVWIFSLVHGLLAGNDPYYALREFRNEAYFVLTYLMVVTACGLKDIRLFIKTSLLVAFGVGVYGLVRFVRGVGIDFMDHVIVFYDITDSVLLYLVMLLIAAFAAEGLLKRKTLIVGLLLFPVALTFLFSYRRGAWVGLIAGLLFLLARHAGRFRLRRLFAWRVWVPVVAIVIVVSAIPAIRDQGLNFAVTRAYSIFDVSEDPSNVFRILDAMNALTAFAHHPLFGVGAGGRYDLEFASNQPVMMEFMDHVSNASHNGYLYVLFKAGMVGFVAYCMVFVQFFRRWLSARKLSATPYERALLTAVGAFVVAVLVNNMTEPLSDLVRPSVLLACVMAWGTLVMRALEARSLPSASADRSRHAGAQPA
jgi:O-antigen ligase